MYFDGLGDPLAFGHTLPKVQEYLEGVARFSPVDTRQRVVRVVKIERNDRQLGEYSGGQFISAGLAVTYGLGMPIHLAECQVMVVDPPPTGEYRHPGVPLARVTSLVMGRSVQGSPLTAVDAVDLTPWYIDGQESRELRAPIPFFPLDWQAELIESIVVAVLMALAFPYTVQPNWPHS